MVGLSATGVDSSPGMSMHMSVVMVRGDHRSGARALFEAFNYRPVESRTLTSWDEVTRALSFAARPSNTIVHKAVVTCGEWTVILDDELVMITDKELCAATARQLNTEIFGVIAEGTSGSYAFWRYAPDLQRSYFTVAGEVETDSGTPLPQEQGLDLPNLFEDGVLLLMERMGLPWSALERCPSYDVWTLDESHMATAVPPAPAPPPSAGPPPPPPPVQPRPWWKFWGN